LPCLKKRPTRGGARALAREKIRAMTGNRPSTSIGGTLKTDKGRKDNKKKKVSSRERGSGSHPERSVLLTGRTRPITNAEKKAVPKKRGAASRRPQAKDISNQVPGKKGRGNNSLRLVNP